MPQQEHFTRLSAQSMRDTPPLLINDSFLAHLEGLTKAAIAQQPNNVKLSTHTALGVLSVKLYEMHKEAGHHDVTLSAEKLDALVQESIKEIETAGALKKHAAVLERARKAYHPPVEADRPAAAERAEAEHLLEHNCFPAAPEMIRQTTRLIAQQMLDNWNEMQAAHAKPGAKVEAEEVRRATLTMQTLNALRDAKTGDHTGTHPSRGEIRM